MINREDVHLSWLESAIIELEGTPDTVAEPPLTRLVWNESIVPLVAQDAATPAPSSAAGGRGSTEVTHARHRNMMNVILGETLEQKRSFEQIAAGREDVLGRRANGPGSPGTGDGVMGVRWIE